VIGPNTIINFIMINISRVCVCVCDCNDRSFI